MDVDFFNEVIEKPRKLRAAKHFIYDELVFLRVYVPKTFRFLVHLLRLLQLICFVTITVIVNNH